MAEWTPARVGRRLREALEAKARLASPKDVGIGTSGDDPKSMGTIGGIGGGEADLASSTEALSWLGWLEPDEAALVEARIEGASWKAICFRFGVSRPTADRWWRCAFALIIWRLKGHSHGPRPSMRFLLKWDGRP